MGTDRRVVARVFTRLAVATLLIAGGACGGGTSGDDGDDQSAREGVEQQGGASMGDPSEGGGLTVSEALTTDAVTILQVRGYVFAQGDEVMLCEAIDDSKTPAECEGKSALLKDYDVSTLDKSSGDTRWSSSEVRVLVNRENGQLVVATNAR